MRGFAGFALSAIIMAAAASILPPVELIPILWFLEMTASLMMARGGWRDGDNKSAALLIAGNWAGWPVGLWLTVTISITLSKTIALVIILVLAASQLARLRIPALSTTAGTLVVGFVAGIASGLAHVGGMVIALYALSRQADARTMRGTLVTFLFIGSLGSLVYQIGFGVMDMGALLRAGVVIPPTALGVWLGQRLFTDRWQGYYRPFCLWLLIVLAAFSLLKHLI